jgi:hypothetical protein
MSSVLDYMFDNDWIQRADIDNLRTSSLRMRSKVVNDSRRIGDLEDQLAHLTLINETLLRILEKKNVIVREEFRSLLVEVDLEDGVHDGKLNKLVSAAPTQAPLPRKPGRYRSRGEVNENPGRFCIHCRRPLSLR